MVRPHLGYQGMRQDGLQRMLVWTWRCAGTRSKQGIRPQA